MADEQSLVTEVTVAVATEMAKEAYKDLAHPTLSSLGKAVATVPQAINRALLPVRQWILKGEYKYAETKKLLALKLENIAPEQIVSPEPYVAVPALQAIGYSMDHEEIREMFANLLASSMTIDTKNSVHPSFVAIIKQLTPDEAKILKFIYHNSVHHVVNMQCEISNKDTEGLAVLAENYSHLAEEIGSLQCNEQIQMYYENLLRLNLLEISSPPVVKSSTPTYTELISELQHKHQALPFRTRFSVKRITLTAFGEAFCKICISSQKNN